MSREIKFRAWDKKHRKYTKVLKIYLSSDGSNLGALVEDYETNYAFELQANQVEFEQYTGLKDKNGKEIYEGDIVRVSGEVALNDDICVDPVAEIVWVDSGAGFGEKFTVKKSPMMPIGLYSYEIIGNIHENPELLEDKNGKN